MVFTICIRGASGVNSLRHRELSTFTALHLSCARDTRKEKVHVEGGGIGGGEERREQQWSPMGIPGGSSTRHPQEGSGEASRREQKAGEEEEEEESKARGISRSRALSRRHRKGGRLEVQQAPKNSCHSLQIKPGCQAPPQRRSKVAGPRTLRLPPITPPLPRAYLSAPPGSCSASQTAGRLPGPQRGPSPPGPRPAQDRLWGPRTVARSGPPARPAPEGQGEGAALGWRTPSPRAACGRALTGWGSGRPRARSPGWAGSYAGEASAGSPLPGERGEKTTFIPIHTLQPSMLPPSTPSPEAGGRPPG